MDKAPRTGELGYGETTIAAAATGALEDVGDDVDAPRPISDPPGRL
ncbi:hypothetical protein [Streptomyces sp. NPDC054888]